MKSQKEKDKLIREFLCQDPRTYFDCKDEDDSIGQVQGWPQPKFQKRAFRTHRICLICIGQASANSDYCVAHNPRHKSFSVEAQADNS